MVYNQNQLMHFTGNTCRCILVFTSESPLHIQGVAAPSQHCLTFCSDEADLVEEIGSLPEQQRYGVNRLEEALGPLVTKGLKTVLLFGVPAKLPKVGHFFHEHVIQPSTLGIMCS